MRAPDVPCTGRSSRERLRRSDHAASLQAFYLKSDIAVRCDDGSTLTTKPCAEAAGQLEDARPVLMSGGEQERYRVPPTFGPHDGDRDALSGKEPRGALRYEDGRFCLAGVETMRQHTIRFGIKEVVTRWWTERWERDGGLVETASGAPAHEQGRGSRSCRSYASDARDKTDFVGRQTCPRPGRVNRSGDRNPCGSR